MYTRKSKMTIPPAAAAAPNSGDGGNGNGGDGGLFDNLKDFLPGFGRQRRSQSSGGSKGGPGKTRCKRGSRRNKAGDCVRAAGYTAKKRCPKGTRRSKVTGACEQLKGMVKKVAKEALTEVAELKKADVAVASAGVDRLAAARAAAALKRLKKGAAKTARVQGKIAAAEKREKEAERVETMAEKERAELLAKIARSRKAMGIRKNEENPAALRRLIEQWEMEARMRIHNRGPKQVEPSAGA